MALGDVVGTALGWAIVVGACGALYFYYTADSGNQRAFRAKGKGAQVLKAAQEAVDPRPTKSQKQKKPQLKSKQSDAGKATKAAESVAVEQPSTARSTGVEKETDDAAFARALDQRRKGASFKSNAVEAGRQKTVKQSNANKRAEPSAAPVVAAEPEDEDEESPAEEDFPELPETELPSGKNVSDMLEAPAPAPGVLRLTEPEFQAPARKQREQKAPQEVESKKQRQNRKKREETQKVREEQESDRRVQLEKQRRTAREARGEPAKNGTTAPVPANNAWSANGTHVPSIIEAATESPLLDTLAADNASVSSSAAPATPASNSGNSNVHYSLPDEDEQMRQLMEQDDSAWTSVPSKARKSEKPAQNATQPPVATNKRSNINNSSSQIHRLGDDVEA